VHSAVVETIDADAQNNVTRLTDTSHATSNNQMGFDELQTVHTLGDAQSLNNEPMAGMIKSRNVTLMTHQDSILDSYNNSTNKTPTNEATATETNPTIQPEVQYNSESLSRQPKKELLYCMTISFPI
jgi:hypothetical protein